MPFLFQGYAPQFKAPATNYGKQLAKLGETLAGTFASHRNAANLNTALGIKEEPGLFSSLFGAGQPQQKPYGQEMQEGIDAAAKAPRVDNSYGAVLGRAVGYGQQEASNPQFSGQPAAPGLLSDKFGSNDPTMAGYFAKTQARESGGNNYAKNPNSSATGLYQFTDGTWSGLMRKYPQLGLTADGRTDPGQQQRAMQVFTSENKNHLEQNGIPATPGNLYAAHFLGAGGAAKFISVAMSNPDTPAAAVVGSQVANANRSIFFNKDGSPKTTGQVYAGLTSKYDNRSDMPAQGASTAQYSQPGLPPASSPSQGATEEQRRAAAAVMSSRFTSPQQQAMAMQVLGTGKGADPTNDMREYDLARRQGYQGSFMDYQTQKSGKDPNTTNNIKEYEYARGQGDQRSYAQWTDDQKRAGAQNISIGGAQGKYGETLDKADAESFLKIREGAQRAINSNASLGHMKTLLQSPGVFQGTGGQLAAQAKGVLNSFGIETEGLAESQAVQAIGNKLALELRDPAGGAGMPGALSDSDRNFLASMVPGLTNSREGNLLLVEYMERMNNRSLQIHRMASEYAQRNGGRLDNGFYMQLGDWAAQNPLFSEGDYERIRGVSPDQGQTTQQAAPPAYLGGYAATSQAPQQGSSRHPPQKTGPVSGSVVNGFVFKGGDPNDRRNWEPAR